MSSADEPSADAKRATLSRELSEFLIELSIALHKHAMYPSDHPSLAPAAAGVVRRADQLFSTRSSISLGVARSQLVIEGVATDSKHPVLADLANRLHKHHLGAVTFHRGIDTEEVVDLLHTLAAEAEREGAQPLGLGPPEKLRVWKNARLHPLAYEKLELLDDESKAPAERDADAELAGGRRVRGAQLWVGLARAALAGHVEVEDQVAQPTVVAKAIDEHPSSAAYDQVIVGYLLQIAEELRTAGGESAVELRRRTSILLRELRPETLQRLVNMGGDSIQRRKFILDAADGLAVEAVVEIMKAAAEASQQQISHSLVRLLSKLASHAEHGVVNSRPIADRGLREQVRRLLSDWQLRDPNPGAYGVALDRISRARPLFINAPAELQTHDDERLIQISLEIGQGGPRVRRAIEKLVREKRYGPLVLYLERFPQSPARDDLRAAVATKEPMNEVLATEPLDLVMLDRLIALMGADAAEPMVNALAASESRSVRRHLINRLLQLGNAIVPVVMTRLDDERWYVVRNLLSLIAELPERPFGFSAAQYTTHADARVRRQAIKMQLAVPDERDMALAGALADEDEEVVRLGLLGFEKQIPLSLEPRIQAMASDMNESAELRELAIRVLAYSHSRTSRDVLVAMVDGGHTLLGKVKLAPKSTEMLAALRALAIGWHGDAVAADLIARAEGSSDPVVRAAVTVARDT